MKLGTVMSTKHLQDVSLQEDPSLFNVKSVII